MTAPDGFPQRVWQVVATLPPGRVASYGQVAAWAGHPRAARQVGRLLSRLPADTRLPWHRVVGADGGLRNRGEGALLQRRRLEAEGVGFNGQRVLPKHRLSPDVPGTAADSTK